MIKSLGGPAGRAPAGLSWRERTRAPHSRPYVEPVKKAKDPVTHRLHRPQKAETKGNTKSVQDFIRNFGRFQLFYLG